MNSKQVLSLVAIAVSLSTFSSVSRSSGCDEQVTYTDQNGREVVDCRVNGDAARERYEQMHSSERSYRDADGGPGWTTREEDDTSCSASYHRTSYQCSQLRDAKTGQVLPLHDRQPNDSNDQDDDQNGY